MEPSRSRITLALAPKPRSRTRGHLSANLIKFLNNIINIVHYNTLTCRKCSFICSRKFEFIRTTKYINYIFLTFFLKLTVYGAGAYVYCINKENKNGAEDNEIWSATVTEELLNPK